MAIPAGWVRIDHPDTEGTAIVTQAAFDAVWSSRGWIVIEEGAAEDTSGVRPAWVQTGRTAGNLTAAVSAAWADLDPSGTAAVRTLDIVLPNMQEGDFFEYRPTFTVGAATGGFLGNLAVIKAGAVQRRCFDETYGFLPWSAPSGAIKDINAGTPRQTVLADDLEADGSLRLRFQYIQASANRSVNAADIIPLTLEGRGPFV